MISTLFNQEDLSLIKASKLTTKQIKQFVRVFSFSTVKLIYSIFCITIVRLQCNSYQTLKLKHFCNKI